MSFEEIAEQQGWDDETVIIILKGFINRVDPTGQEVARYAAECAEEENAEAWGR